MHAIVANLCKIIHTQIIPELTGDKSTYKTYILQFLLLELKPYNQETPYETQSP